MYSQKREKLINSSKIPGLVCENCGNPVDNSPACNLLGKRLCISCFKKLRAETTVVCKECSKTIPYTDRKSQLCPDCWRKQLFALREFHGAYHTALSDSLREKGISVSSASTKYVDASGRAMFPVIPFSTDCLPLRKNVHGMYDGDECAIFTLEVRDGVFALPDNGIGIRYLKAINDIAFMNKANALGHGHILSLASDGKDLFILNDAGWVLSTRQNWEKYQLFTVMDELRRIACQYFDESEISAAVNSYELGQKASITDTITYDSAQKAFIEYEDYGNFHEGVERSYSEISRQDVLDQLTSHPFDLRNISFSAQRGTIPVAVIVDKLAVHEKGIKIHVPESHTIY